MTTTSDSSPTAFRFPDLLLPRPEIDLHRWAVIACDQFTSDRSYWDEVAKIVGDSPSTYHLILPEVFLRTPVEELRVQSSRAAMREYVERGLFVEHRGPIYVERTVAGRVRRGLMLCLDLEQYEFSPGSQSLIRATEGTILERLPPRVRIREGAPLELPHIVVFIDDPECTVIEPIAERKASLERLYDFELMLGSGRLSGYDAAVPDLERAIDRGLRNLANPDTFARKYAPTGHRAVLQFAIGDGNHSLATAKTIWERTKASVRPDHPLRYALVEIENVHDAGVVFEPIHRALFGCKSDIIETLRALTGGAMHFRPCATIEDALAVVNRPWSSSPTPDQTVAVLARGQAGVLSFAAPTSPSTLGTLQPLLDRAQADQRFDEVDYVHGTDAVCKLAARDPRTTGLFLPALAKTELFKTVIADGVLPRKAFSMGHAIEKRFYLECRRLE